MTRCMPDRPDLDEKLTVHTPRGNIQVSASKHVQYHKGIHCLRIIKSQYVSL